MRRRPSFAAALDARWHRTAVFVVVALAVLLLASSAAASRTRNYTGVSFGPDGAAGNKSFARVQSVAVDPADGDVLVDDGGADKIYKFDSDGEPVDFPATGTNAIEAVGGVGGEGEGAELQVAVAPPGAPGGTEGDIYVATNSEEPGKLVKVYSPAGAEIGSFGEGDTCGVAVDPAGRVFVGSYGQTIREYVPTAEFPAVADPTATGTAEIGLCNVAADSLGDVYAARYLGRVYELEGLADTTPTLVDEKAKTMAVGADDDLYADREDEVRQYDPTGRLLGSFGSGELSGSRGVALSPDAAEAYVGTPATVRIYGETVVLADAETRAATDVTGGLAVLNGTIDPAGGPPATCFFEYVAVSAKGFEGASTAPCSPAGPFTSSTPVAVSAQLTGLPEGFYRFRLVVENENGASEGESILLENYSPLSGALPDGRAYELVSPAQKAGEVFPPGAFPCQKCGGQNEGVLPTQAAPDGEAVVYQGQPFAAGDSPEFNQYFARRNTSGWNSTDLSSATVTGGWDAFSPDLSRAVLSQTEPALSAEAPTRGGVAFANIYLTVDGGPPRPLVTVEPPHRNPGTGGGLKVFRLQYATANSGTAGAPAFTHLAFEADDALTPAVTGVAPAAPEVEESEQSCPIAHCDLYEWTEGGLHLVNVLPGNITAASEAAIGSGTLLPESPALEAAVVTNAVSADGSRVFWTDEETGQTYVRVDGSETVRVQGPGTCSESTPVYERTCFLTASSDGSRVLLSDGRIYALNPAGNAYEPTVDLTDGEGGFKGILGAASDLSRTYFVDTAALTPESETNANGEHAEAGAFNLYLGEKGSSRFIGALSVGDNSFNNKGSWHPGPSNRTAQVTPDGRHVAFMSTAPLTGYDSDVAGGGNCPFGEGAQCPEVFVYDAATARLSCASCNASGERPLGGARLSLLKTFAGRPAFRQPANLSAAGEGRLFFESEDTLSARDLNGKVIDVYEWEPAGIGSCTRADGCVALISSGDSPDDSQFIDSTPSGDDAFFIATSRLVAADKDDRYDLYDARAGGGFAEATSAPCSGEACRGSTSSSQFTPVGPGSSTFVGPGNERSKCKRGSVRRHGKCIKKHHASNHHGTSKKRAGHRRGGAR